MLFLVILLSKVDQNNSKVILTIIYDVIYNILHTEKKVHFFLHLGPFSDKYATSVEKHAYFSKSRSFQSRPLTVRFNFYCKVYSISSEWYTNIILQFYGP